MGSVTNGKWIEDDSALIQNNGFQRPVACHGGEIHQDIIEAIVRNKGRFHLIASQSCPWSHRVLIALRLKKLEPLIEIKIASGKRVEGYPVNENEAWRLPGTEQDIVYVHEVYTAADRKYTGRATVPLLWDSLTGKVVSNESLELLKAFDRVENLPPDCDITLYPQDMRIEIDALNKQIFDELANGVYRAGLARDQHNYDAAASDVFRMLDLLETRLSDQRLLFGHKLTLSDVVLFPVLVRFDITYHTLFRCTRRRLIDYPMLWAYARDLFSLVPFAEDVDFAAIQRGYFLNDGEHNPYRIISDLPDSNWSAPHQRAGLGALSVFQHSGRFRDAVALNQTSDTTKRTSL